MRTISQAAQRLWAKKSKDGISLWLPLAIHLYDSAALARKLWNCWLSDGAKQVITEGVTDGSDPEQIFVFLAAAHDIGKGTPVFQAKPSAFYPNDLDECITERLLSAGLQTKPWRDFRSPEKTPHALATQILLENENCPVNITAILGAHHGKPPDSNTKIHCRIGAFKENFHLGEEGREKWTAVQKELIGYALGLAGFSSLTEIPRPNIAAQVLLCGLVIMADWLASNEEYFPYYRLEEDPYKDDTQARMKTAWKRICLSKSWQAGNTWMNADLYRERFKGIRFDSFPNEMQKTVVQIAAGIHSPGILVLEAPMGSGKTEAALAAAEIFANKAMRTGVFFALPTQATSDGIFPRVRDWLGKLSDGAHTLELAHGKAQFNEDLQALRPLNGNANISDDEEGSAVVHQWFKGRKKALLADFVVGTIDQLLLAALKQKHVMLRHLGLANKVVIVDECHAYDAYMSRYLEMALKWLGAYHVPVIVLSATLPAQKRKMVIEAYTGKDCTPKQKSDPLKRSKSVLACAPMWATSRHYPLITYTDSGDVKQHEVPVEEFPHEVSLDYLSDEMLAEKMDDLLSDGGCAGVIVNTVKRAQEFARELRARFGDDIVELLHSRFLTPDRNKKERKLKEELGRPGPDTRRPEKRIVVGTQVLEQSLDIDFDVLITDICPMDLLLQRIGRLHRHKRIRHEKLRDAFCFITGINGDGFEAGAKDIYGEYLLMRTKAWLPIMPNKLILPRDIPYLVQEVYDNEADIFPKPSGYSAAKEKWEKIISDKEKRAGDFRISPPWQGNKFYNLVGWLDTDVSDKHSEAAVRDTDESFDVLLIQERGNKLYFLPWCEGGRELPADETPDDELAKAIARQSIRLPRALCHRDTIKETIGELECLNNERLPLWQKSHWLEGELILILDEAYSATLGKYRITYTLKDGLLYEKEDIGNA